MKDEDKNAMSDALLTSQELLAVLLDNMRRPDWHCHDCAPWRAMIDLAMRKNSEALAALFPGGVKAPGA